MAGICTNSIRKSGAGCDHRTVTVNLDGESIAIETGEGPLDELPWDDANKRLFILLGLKRLRTLGLALDNAIGRVTNGEEGTNMRQWTILAKDITKTNIGTAYVNIQIGANGERSLVDFTGATQFRIILNANLVGTGQWGARLIRDGDSAVLYENANLGASGERELDTDWQALPAAAVGLTTVRLQGKSTTGADDPVFRRCVLLTR